MDFYYLLGQFYFNFLNALLKCIVVRCVFSLQIFFLSCFDCVVDVFIIISNYYATIFNDDGYY